MPDETRVFDVTRPSHVSPPATSKPVIVGHQPIITDPMVKDDDKPAPMRISVTDADGPMDAGPTEKTEHDEKMMQHEHTIMPPVPEPDPAAEAGLTTPEPQPESPKDSPDGAPAIFSPPEETTPAIDAAAVDAPGEEPDQEAAPSETAAPEQPWHPDPEASSSSFTDHPQPQIEGLHFDHKKSSHKGLYAALLVVLALLVGGYLAVDAGWVGSGINLPFHVFKQKTASTPPAQPTPVKQNASTGPLIPSGFKKYKIAGTPITFAAPAVWGDPSSTTEAGFSKRGGTNQSDGTYAYLVNFTNNKDIQIVVTSSKYLSPARTAGTPLYYDYLQWCTGTNDGQIYESVLNSSTTGGVTTPTTITCDKGPVAGATKLDSTTILQTKAADTANKTIGDIYTKNLTDPTLAVFRVKDAAMTNGNAVKSLLNTVQTSASS